MTWASVAPEWMMQHFRDPQSVTPGSVMPRFRFTEAEARALTDFLIHMREQAVALLLPSLMSPVERGREVFRKYGCAGCHGPGAKGGVPNPNSKTAEQVPGLLHVADGYTVAQLKDRINKGQHEIAALDANALRLLSTCRHGRASSKMREVDDLVSYLVSLKPKEENIGF